MNVYKKISVSALTITVIVLSCLSSCRSSKPVVDTKDLSYMYNPTRNNFTPSYKINTFTGESATLSARFMSNNLFFSEANSAGVATASIVISARLYKIVMGSRVLSDTITYDINIIRDPQKQEYLYNIPLKTESGSQYVVEIKTLDKLRTIVSQSFVPFNTLSSLNMYNFIVKDYFGQNHLFSHTLKIDEYINLYYTRGNADSLYISYFKPYDQIPDPPSMLLPQKTIDYESERIAAVPYSDTLPLMLPREGIYLFTVDRKSKEGYTLFNFGESYPNVTTPEQMIEPLIYIANRDELAQMKANSNPKIAVDEFWINCGGGSIERARELIRIYYNRVIYSNIYFTSFTEGWRTERGMIYIIYGPPDKVYKNPDGDLWGYRKQTVKSSWGGRYSVSEDYIFFTFKQNDNVFSDNDYFLSRNESLVTYWNQAIASWRKGVVFQMDDPGGTK